MLFGAYETGISIRNNTILSGSECLESNLSELSFEKWPQEAEVERCIEAGASGALSSDPVLWVRVFHGQRRGPGDIAGAPQRGRGTDEGDATVTGDAARIVAETGEGSRRKRGLSPRRSRRSSSWRRVSMLK